MKSDLEADIYKAYMGLGPKRIPHWEHWSNPDAETYLTGIDYFLHPRLCRLKMRELYPELQLSVPDSDEPKQRVTEDDTANYTVRWGDGQTGTFLHGERYFKSPEDVFAFSPLAHADMRNWGHSVMNWDFSSEESIEAHLRQAYPAPWETPEKGAASSAGFYNTMFMWPLLTFGWDMFLCCCLEPGFERIMDEFAEINRRVFRVLSRLPVNFIICHDDIATSRGPVCSPEWMKKYIFPRYEEFFGILRSQGKEVIFMADGCVDMYAGDVMACGARGIISEPFTDYKAIARRHKDCFLAGEGDNRVLMRGIPAEIEAMVRNMVETARMSGGYMMCIGNHIPWNVPGEAVERYIDYSRIYGVRE